MLIKRILRFVSDATTSVYYIRERDGRYYPFIKRPFMEPVGFWHGSPDRLATDTPPNEGAYRWSSVHGHRSKKRAVDVIRSYAGSEDVEIEMRA